MIKAEEVLRLLKRRGGYATGAEIGRKLGITRGGVWRHVSSLRARGFVIGSSKRLGYRFVSSPGTPTEAEVGEHLRTKMLGRRYIFLAEAESTNDIAKKLASEGAPEGTVVVADSQTSGRGRMDRRWHSPPGKNLYMSAILRPKLPPHVLPQLMLAASVAVARAVEKTIPGGAGIKWPNDVLIQGKKVAGILAEMSTEGDRVQSVVLGIGVNLNMAKAEFPRELRETATSVGIRRGEAVNRAKFTSDLLGELEACYRTLLAEGFGPLKVEWERRSVATGRRISIKSGKETVSGTARGIDEEGSLLLDTGRGVEKIRSGDVTVIK